MIKRSVRIAGHATSVSLEPAFWEALGELAARRRMSLNALLSASSGASWVSVHHGGGMGIGNSIHAGLVVVADGSAEMDERLARVLTNDPGIGVARHADAGYDTAIETARTRGVRLPMEEHG